MENPDHPHSLSLRPEARYQFTHTTESNTTLRNESSISLQHRTNRFFFVCGPHCSGKTSIIARLREEGIIATAGEEIGKKFYYERKAPGFDTALAGEDFEYEVTTAELKRDYLITSTGAAAALETWHPGNLAYVLQRTPRVFDPLVRLIRQASPFFTTGNITGIRLTVSRDVIRQRTRTFADNRDWAADFYFRMNELLPLCLSALHLESSTITIDADRPYEEVYQEVKRVMMPEKVLRSRKAGLPQVSGSHTTSNIFPKQQGVI